MLEKRGSKLYTSDHSRDPGLGTNVVGTPNGDPKYEYRQLVKSEEITKSNFKSHDKKNSETTYLFRHRVQAGLHFHRNSLVQQNQQELSAYTFVQEIIAQ